MTTADKLLSDVTEAAATMLEAEEFSSANERRLMSAVNAARSYFKAVQHAPHGRCYECESNGHSCGSPLGVTVTLTGDGSGMPLHTVTDRAGHCTQPCPACQAEVPLP